jgi:hypothetical protein
MSGETTVHLSGACGFCGYWHGPTCPNIEEIEYFPDGRVKRFKLRPIQPSTEAQASLTWTTNETHVNT